MPMSSAGLSFVPNVSIANSLTNGGAASISRSPTSSTGDRHARSRPASSSATAERDAGRRRARRGRRTSGSGDRPAGGRGRWRAGIGGRDVLGGHRRAVRHGPSERGWTAQSRSSRSTARSIASREARPPRRRSPRRRSVGAIVVPALVGVDHARVDVRPAGDGRRVAEVLGHVDHRRADGPLAARRRADVVGRSASATAASTVPCHVRKSFADTSPPTTSLT